MGEVTQQVPQPGNGLDKVLFNAYFDNPDNARPLLESIKADETTFRVIEHGQDLIIDWQEPAYTPPGVSGDEKFKIGTKVWGTTLAAQLAVASVSVGFEAPGFVAPGAVAVIGSSALWQYCRLSNKAAEREEARQDPTIPTNEFIRSASLRAVEAEHALLLSDRDFRLDTTLGKGLAIETPVMAGGTMSTETVLKNIAALDVGFAADLSSDTLGTKLSHEEMELDRLQFIQTEVVEKIRLERIWRDAPNPDSHSPERLQKLEAQAGNLRKDIENAEKRVAEQARFLEDGQENVSVSFNPTAVVKRLLERTSDAESFLTNAIGPLIDMSSAQTALEKLAKDRRTAAELTGLIDEKHQDEIYRQELTLKHGMLDGMVRVGASWLATEWGAEWGAFCNTLLDHLQTAQEQVSHDSRQSEMKLEALENLWLSFTETTNTPDMMDRLTTLRTDLKRIVAA